MYVSVFFQPTGDEMSRFPSRDEAVSLAPSRNRASGGPSREESTTESRVVCSLPLRLRYETRGFRLRIHCCCQLACNPNFTEMPIGSYQMMVVLCILHRGSLFGARFRFTAHDGRRLGDPQTGSSLRYFTLILWGSRSGRLLTYSFYFWVGFPLEHEAI
jgi:hypothetical protein